ncbi:MAG: nucleoside deaminase [Gammaproteobacteria bacterium]|nr:nucleoside deaminase [Gammaproteobacteria bacterium]
MESGSGGPFGAVIVRDGRILGEGGNRVLGDHDPTAHAEVVAIRDACARLQVHHLQGCVLYASCEPCPMCLASAYWAHVDAIYHANTREDAATAGFDDAFLYEELDRPVPERRLPMHRLQHPGADEPMQIWLRLEDRIEY